jgi:hypothetical protein
MSDTRQEPEYEDLMMEYIPKTILVFYKDIPKYNLHQVRSKSKGWKAKYF